MTFQHVKAFVGAMITIAKQIAFFFQIENCGREVATFFAGALGKLSENIDALTSNCTNRSDMDFDSRKLSESSPSPSDL
jgi:hypothetical protein